MDTQVEILGKNMEVTDRIDEYVRKKISKFDRLLADLEDVRIDLSYLKAARSAADRHVAQVTLRGKGYILRTEERADDLFAAFDSSMDKMQRMIERYKGKKSHGRGDGKPASEVSPEEIKPDELGEDGLRIAKRKSFHLVPMDEMEALEQMKLLGHENFFVFYNISVNAINVIYHRRDGTFGIITPEVG